MLVLTLTLITVVCRPLLAQTETKQLTEDPTAIQLAISQLGDTDPSVRKKAQVELQQFGAAAVDELKKAAKFETTLDYETQIAAAGILESIEETMAIEQTNKFVLGEATLPGWQDFEKFAGDSPESRSLFRDIYLKNRSELAKALDPAVDHVVGYTQLKTLFESTELKQLCLGMFLLAHQQTRQNAAENSFLLERPSELQMGHLLNLPTLRTSPLAKLRSNIGPVALLTLAVIETAPKEYRILNRKIALLQQVNSPEVGPLLVEFATSEKPTVVRALAIAHAFKIGDAKNFDRLKEFLTDDTVVGQFLSTDKSVTKPLGKNGSARPPVIEVQIRDIVLLGNVLIAEKDHTDFGFSPAAVNSAGYVNIKQAGFLDNEARTKAFERYQPLNQ